VRLPEGNASFYPGDAMTSKNVLIIIVIMAILPVLGLATVQLNTARHKESLYGIYYCPMHPQILYEHQGNCPICGMKLIKKGNMS